MIGNSKYWQCIYIAVFVLTLFTHNVLQAHATQQTTSKTLTAVIPFDSPPTYYKDSSTNKAAGFAVDIMNAIGQQTGYEIKYEFKKDWTEIIEAVKTGEADIAPEMGVTEERIKVLSFTLPTDTFPVVIFVRTNSGIDEVRKGMKVGAIKGSAAYEKLKKMHDGIEVTTYDSFQNGLFDLLAGQIDAFCCPAPTLMQLAIKAGLEDRIKIVGQPIMELKRAIAVRQGNNALLAELNKAVDDFVNTPAYQQIYSKWYGKRQTYWTEKKIITFAALFGIAIIVIMGGWRHYSLVKINRRLLETESKLKHSELFARTIIETEPECVKIIDADCNLIMMNKAGLDMLQVDSLEQVKGQNVCPIVSPEYRDAFMKLTKEVFSGVSGTLTFEMVGVKGRHLWLETHAVPFRNENNEIFGLLSITRDVTESKKAEIALIQSEANFRTLFNKSADAIFLVRPDGSIADVNDMACKRYKYSREELIRMNVSQIDSPATSKLAPERTARVMEKGVVAFEAEHVAKDGEIFPVEAKASSILLNGEPILISTCRDITERKKAEELLSDERERLAVTLRSIGDGVIVTDIEGNITLINKVGEVLTGWTFEEAKGKPLTDVFKIINEATREQCENPSEKVIRTGMVVGLANHTALIRKDGSEIIIADSGAPIKDKESKTIGVVLVFRDITAQYRMEQEMQKMQKLESLGIFAGGLAHDFNNLLTSIIGNISLSKMFIGMNHKAFERLTEAEKAAQRATDLTHQLLTFAKGGAPIKKVESISEIVKESVNFALSGSNIKSIYAIPLNLWSTEVDKGQMTQVFNNLIINAVQAMPDGGTVTIKFDNVTMAGDEVSSLHKGDYVKVSFNDEGIGIKQEYLEKIFDPYFTTKKSGSGLGLSTVYSILNRHDGGITVESTVGIGTTFSIYIPAVRGTVTSEREEREGISYGKGKILIMDDEPLVRNVIGEILNALGYEVGFAEDGKQAIEIYKRAEGEAKPFDAVVMDLTIPGGMGGKEAVSKLLEVAPNAKVIVSSGYSTDPIMSDYRKYGFCSVITKPYNTNQVSEAIRNIMMDRDSK